MLQRIQTIYLLLVSTCMVLASVLPLATLTFNGQPVTFESMGFFQQKEIIFPTWGLFALGVISAVIPLITVFLYKKRILQIRLTLLNIFIIIGFYAFFFFLIFMGSHGTSTSFEKIAAGLIMPFVAIIFSWLAIRKIGADETLVRSLNRLR